MAGPRAPAVRRPATGPRTPTATAAEGGQHDQGERHAEVHVRRGEKTDDEVRGERGQPGCLEEQQPDRPDQGRRVGTVGFTPVTAAPYRQLRNAVARYSAAHARVTGG